jgi:SEC-C motif-containing protein
MNPKNNACPCGRGESIAACCGRFISGQEKPPGCEDLMRSRYTAFTQADVSYIRRTMKDKALQGFDAKTTKAWAESVQWLGLTVINVVENGNKGSVEFCAKFSENNEPGQIHEVSQFYRAGDQWYYTGGQHQ